MILSLVPLLLPLLLHPQEAVPVSTSSGNPSLNAGVLRKQIHDMRKTLLLGGKSVDQSELEAIRFFQSKQRSLDKRLDQIQGELVEKRTSYDLAVDRAGQAIQPADRDAALAEAATLKDEIRDLEEESVSLHASRKALLAEISRIQERRRERDRLAAKLDAQGSNPSFIPFATGGVGLAPEAVPPKNPLLANPGLQEDFLRRYPLRGRQMLFEADPASYWQRWPLTPPADLLAPAIPFPAPDLPGRR